MAVWVNVAIDYKVKCDKCSSKTCAVERKNGDHHMVSMEGAMKIAEAHRCDMDGAACLPCIKEIGPVNYRCTCPDCISAC